MSPEGRATAGGAAAGARLYVVATPIGNLGDVTLRALEVLRAVPLIAAEDTRIAARLLRRYEITTRTVSYHARSGPGRREQLLAHLRDGADLALVTDAGTPGISDPGDDLVAAWAAEGGIVVPIPGASAVLAAVVASGLAGARWGFEGFLPRSGRERRERLGRIATDERATVLYESPNRLGATLADLAGACGGTRRAAVCRELTKVHEQVARGSLEELAAQVRAGAIPSRGEIVLVIAGAPTDAATEMSDDEHALRLAQARTRVAELMRDGASRSQAAADVARVTGLPRRTLYRDDEAP